MIEAQSNAALRTEHDTRGNSPPPAQSDFRLDLADRLFACFVALAIVTVYTPLRTLHSLLTWTLTALLPLATYQDLLLLAVLAWIFHGLFAIAQGQGTRRLIAVAGWTLCLVLALYTYLSDILYLIIRRPLTVGLIVAADNLRAIQASAEAIITPGLIGALVMAPICTVLIASILIGLAPEELKRLRSAFSSTTGLLIATAYFLGARAWTVRYEPYSLLSFNPQWTLVSSLFEGHTPIIADAIPPGYLDDFQPVKMRPSTDAEDFTVAGLSPAAWPRPLNVVMVVMESVGTRRLQLYGAPFDDTPNLVELARHALVFKRMYVSEGETSAAYGALFTSVYPDHDWPSITQLAPELTVRGLPAVLAKHGYRTAFIHSGQVLFDRQGEFLNSHGFEQLIVEPRDYDAPQDPELLPKTLKWIESDPARPFFVTVWTHDTHHPYVAASHRDYGVHDANYNRYLNGVHATDGLIGDLAAGLQRMGLADRTLLVIMGDHGEAFGEHGQLIHGGSVYNEGVHAPLLIVNPKLFPHRIDVDRLTRQIDIAPTLLALMGYPLPGRWQGANVLGSHPPKRAYLFAGTGNFTFGIVEGDFKYIYDFQRERSQLYNLAVDGHEKDNLASDPAYTEMIKRDHLRLEAWVSFQNRYLARYENPERPEAINSCAR